MNQSSKIAFAGKYLGRRSVTALTCASILLLPACQIPKLRHAQTGLRLPTDYSGTTSADNSSHLRVDEFYSDPVLLQLICQSVANNRELKMLEEEIQVARSAVISGIGAYFPLVGFRAGAGWDQNSAFNPIGASEKQLEYRPGQHFPTTPGYSILGFNFLLPIDIWRELRNARDAAIQRYQAAIERRNFFMTRMVADVAENYYNLMALDQRLIILDQIISFQQQSLEIARARFAAGRGTELGVQRFQAEVRKNQSEKLIVRQEIVETENRINFLAGRFPQPVPRNSANFFELTIHALSVGVPAQLLQNRPDIRQAERNLAAAGLDVKVARAHFFPRLDINGFVGYQAFNPKYLFHPEALVLNAVGELMVPVINKAAIRAEYLAASAMQLESIYNYQKVIINAVVEVVNRMAMVENFSRSIELKQQQIRSLENSVGIAEKLFQAARVEYIDVLFAQRDLLDAKTVLINTKRQQLSAIVNVYQALGGGASIVCPPPEQLAAVAGQPQPAEAPNLPAPRPLPDPAQGPPAGQPLPPPAQDKQPPAPANPPVAEAQPMPLQKD